MADRIQELTSRLRGLPPRSAKTLSWRLLEGLDREACARLYGITPEAFDRMLYQAARELTGAPPSPLPDWEEEARAIALRKTMQEGQAPSPEVAKEAALLRELAQSAPAIKAALEAAEREEEASPRRRREDFVRRLVVVVILLLTAYFYLQSRPPS